MIRYLQFRNSRTDEAAKPIDVAGKTERQVEQIERGMLINCNVDGGWYVDDTSSPAPVTEDHRP